MYMSDIIHEGYHTGNYGTGKPLNMERKVGDAARGGTRHFTLFIMYVNVNVCI